MPRLPALPVDRLTDDQRKLFAKITGGARAKTRAPADFLNEEGSLKGPFNAFLYAPEIGDAAQRLGELLRFNGSLPGALRELAILTVAVHWRAQYEWWAHEKIARAEGLDDAAIEAVKIGQAPPGEEGLTIVHSFVRELLIDRRVADQTYQAAQLLLGNEGVVELVILIGYYGLISASLNAFQVPLPEGVTPPLPED